MEDVKRRRHSDLTVVRVCRLMQSPLVGGFLRTAIAEVSATPLVLAAASVVQTVVVVGCDVISLLMLFTAGIEVGEGTAAAVTVGNL